MGRYLDGNGLSHFMSIIKGAFASKADAVKNITRSGTTFTATRADGTTFTFTQQETAGPEKATSAPLMDGTAAIGSSSKYAAENHVHPSDTTRVPTSRTVNGQALTGNITLTGSDINTTTQSGTSIAEAISTLQSTATTVANIINGTQLVGQAALADQATEADTAAEATEAESARKDGEGNIIASTYATKSELATAVAGALQYKGTVDAEATITGAAYKKGWYYIVATAGTYVGKVCEVGDMLIAKQNKTSTPANDWDAVQSNIEILTNNEIDTLWNAA